MPGRARLQEIVTDSIKNIAAEADHLRHAATNPSWCKEAYVDEHAARAHEAVDKAAEACRVLVREG